MYMTPVKERVTKALGPRWTLAQIAERAGVRWYEVAQVAKCTGDSSCRARHTPGVQDAVAKAVGLSPAELFGKHAWFRLAAYALKAQKAGLRRTGRTLGQDNADDADMGKTTARKQRRSA